MKVILQQDVRGQGKKGQLVEVSDGYARNFLFPRKLAVAATTDNVNTMKLQDKARREREAKEKAEAMELVQKLKDCPVKVAAKAGAGGKLFGSVTTKEISAALTAAGEKLRRPQGAVRLSGGEQEALLRPHQGLRHLHGQVQAGLRGHRQYHR